MTEEQSIIPFERIIQWIIKIRGRNVMLDKNLARLYGVDSKESTCRAGGFGMPLKGAEFLLFILRPLLPFLAFHAPPSLDPLRITPHGPLAPNSRNSLPLCFPLHHTIPREQPHRHLLS